MRPGPELRTARLVLRGGLDEVLSFTSVRNPRVPEGHPIRPHVLYRIDRAAWESSA